jgi:hypothetical protein
VGDARKVALEVCKGPMARYNALMNPREKLAYDEGSKRETTDYAKILLDLFLRDYAKALTVIKQN